MIGLRGSYRDQFGTKLVPRLAFLGSRAASPWAGPIPHPD
jgi:hypothetical protein